MRAIGKGPPVPRHLRNPRRSYDEEGRECEPATVANVRQNSARGIIARCACNYEALPLFERLDPDWFVTGHRPAPALLGLQRQADRDAPGLDWARTMSGGSPILRIMRMPRPANPH